MHSHELATAGKDIWSSGSNWHSWHFRFSNTRWGRGCCMTPPSNDPAGHYKYSEEITQLYILSGNWRYCDGVRKFSAIICDGACTVFDGETKISTGKQQKTRRGKTQTWRENRYSWWVTLLPWWGSVSAVSLLGVLFGVTKWHTVWVENARRHLAHKKFWMIKPFPGVMGHTSWRAEIHCFLEA